MAHQRMSNIRDDPEISPEPPEGESPAEHVHLGHFREDMVRGGNILSVVDEEAEEGEEGAHAVRSSEAGSPNTRLKAAKAQMEREE